MKDEIDNTPEMDDSTLELQSVLAEAAKLDDEPQFAPQQGEQERGGLLPPEPEPVQERDASIAGALQMIFGAGFTILAPNWQVSSEECVALSEAWCDCIEHYFPDAGKYMGPGVTAAALTAAVVMPRLNTPRKLEPEKQTESPDRGEHGSTD